MKYRLPPCGPPSYPTSVLSSYTLLTLHWGFVSLTLVLPHMTLPSHPYVYVRRSRLTVTPGLIGYYHYPKHFTGKWFMNLNKKD